MCAERGRLVHCRTSSTPPPQHTHTHSSLAGSGHRGVDSEGLVQQLRVGVTVVVHQHPSAVHVALDLVHQQHAAVVVHVLQQLQHGRRHVLRPAANAKGGTGSGGLHTEHCLHCNYNLGRGGTTSCGLHTEHYLHCHYHLRQGSRHWFMQSSY